VDCLDYVHCFLREPVSLKLIVLFRGTMAFEQSICIRSVRVQDISSSSPCRCRWEFMPAPPLFNLPPCRLPNSKITAHGSPLAQKSRLMFMQVIASPIHVYGDV